MNSNIMKDIKLLTVTKGDHPYSFLLALQEYADKKIEKGELKKDFHYSFPFPNTKNSFGFYIDNNQNCVLQLNINDKVYYANKSEKNIKEVQNNCHNIFELMKKNNLHFTPAYNNDFYKEVASCDVGSVMILNTSKAISCVKRDGANLLFKECFTGDLDNLTIDCFKSSKTYSVDLDNPATIQNLFDYAYSIRTLTANLRCRHGSDYGQTQITSIESKLSSGESAKIHIGPEINLKVYNIHNQYIWYEVGETTNKIDRELVANILGWANLSLPEISAYKENSSYLFDMGRETAFLQDIQESIAENDFLNVVNKAFYYANNQNSPVFLNMKGLEPLPDGSYNLVQFAFYENHIIKLKYETDCITPIEIGSVTNKEFIDFCNNKYDNTVKVLNTVYSDYVSQYKENNPQNASLNEEKAVKELIKRHFLKIDPLIKPDDMEHANSLAASLVREVLHEENCKNTISEYKKEIEKEEIEKE